MLRYIYILLMGLTLGYAAQTQVRVTVDRNKIYEGDSVTLTISVEDGNGYPQLDISEITDFQIISGPNQSSNMQWVNGEVSSTHSLVYIMIPKKKGEISIPQMTIKADGKTYKSDPITITVFERKDQFTTGNNEDKPKRQYFIEAKVDNPNPYRGEQVTLTYTIYTKINLSGFETQRNPRYQGFWTHDLYTPRNLQIREVIRGGTKWYAGTVKKIALFPTKSGKIDIEPLTATIALRVEDRSQRSIFSNFFANTKNYTISSNSIQLDVKSLPNNDGKVSSAIGEWTVSSRVTENDVKQNEAITLQIRLQGKGNLQAVDIQDLHFPDEIEVFDPTISVDEHPQGDIIAGTKTIEYVLIPRETGNIKIPSVELVYFDTRQKRWRSRATQPIVLRVSPGDKNYSSEIGFTKKEVSLMGRDIHFADQRSPIWRRTDKGIISPFALALLIASIIFYLTPWVLDFNQARAASTVSSRKAKKAFESAVQKLGSYSGDSPTDYRNIQTALTTFLNMKENLKKERSSSDIIQSLKSHKISEKIISQIEEILLRGDAVRFAPVSKEDSKTDFQTIIKLLKELNSQWDLG